MKEYSPRVIDSIFNLKLETMGSLYVKGAKCCGKNTPSERFAKREVWPERSENRRTDSHRTWRCDIEKTGAEN